MTSLSNHKMKHDKYTIRMFLASKYKHVYPGMITAFPTNKDNRVFYERKKNPID